MRNVTVPSLSITIHALISMPLAVVVDCVRGPILAAVGVRSKVWVAPKTGHAIPATSLLKEAVEWLDAGLPVRRKLAKDFPASRASSVDAPLVAPDALRAGKAAAALTVASANPKFGDRGTTLDVHVIGSGFTAGAQATWLLHGNADPAHVRTNSTRFVSSTEVVANITVASDADLARQDLKFRQLAVRRDAANFIGFLLRKPQMAIGAERNTNRSGVRCRQRELDKFCAARIKAADLAGTTLAEP
jgi:hypothetical protein